MADLERRISKRNISSRRIQSENIIIYFTTVNSDMATCVLSRRVDQNNSSTARDQRRQNTRRESK